MELPLEDHSHSRLADADADSAGNDAGQVALADLEMKMTVEGVIDTA